MTEVEKQALALYEEICASSKDRPFSASSVGEMMRKLAEWRKGNRAFDALRRSGLEVQLAFLNQSFGWLQAEARDHSRFLACQSITDAIQLVLETVPKPLPAELVMRLLSEYRMDFSTRLYFPFEQLYSEVMRDVDLFTSVCAVGEDEGWSDQGERGVGLLSDKFDPNQQSAVINLRADLLARVLPHTPISDRCKIVETVLEVKGQLGTYRIHLSWGGTVLITESGPRWLQIPQKLLAAVELALQDVPLELDYRSEMILRRAYVLANDWNINSPELIKQIMPK
jgi:hypothetical protein